MRNIKKLSAKAPAKVNLTLEIKDKLPSGFHKMNTVMLKLNNFHDKIEIFFSKSNDKILIESNIKDIPTNKDNICRKVAEAFFQKLNKKVGIKIILTKNIPHGAGLGGGSSDAATTLLFLNKYFGNPFSRKQLAEMSYSIGKDISFFFSEKNAAFMTGMCEIKKEEFDFKDPQILIVNPCIKIPTKEAFENLADSIWFMKDKSRADISSQMTKAIKSNELDLIASNLFNDFEITIERKYPEIKEIKQSLKALGAMGSVMSGSGSTVFGIFKNKQSLTRAQNALKKHYPSFIIAKG